MENSTGCCEIPGVLGARSGFFDREGMVVGLFADGRDGSPFIGLMIPRLVALLAGYPQRK